MRPVSRASNNWRLLTRDEVRASVHVLWYPERKFFLLGRKLDAALLAGLQTLGDAT